MYVCLWVEFDLKVFFKQSSLYGVLSTTTQTNIKTVKKDNKKNVCVEG